MDKKKLKRMLEESQAKFENIQDSAIEYKRNYNSLLSYVNKSMKSREDILKLIGGNSLDMLEDNHQNHLMFMQSVFTYNQHELLVKTLPWVYNAYVSKGFEYQYFYEELKYWIEAMYSIKNEKLNPIIDVYKQMLEWHEDIILMSQNKDMLGFIPDVLWTDEHQDIMHNLLLGKHRVVLNYLMERFEFPSEIEKVYLDFIQPVLYMIGKHWEEGRISIAQEHIAASATSRLMAHIHMQYDTMDHIKGDIVVSTSANEFHQIGARMVADFLENQGWNVRFLGADIPKESLGEILDQINPEIVALSVTMDYNVEKVLQTIKYIRSNEVWKGIKIMVGGIAVNNDPSLQHVLGADAYPSNAFESYKIAEQWHKEK